MRGQRAAVCWTALISVCTRCVYDWCLCCVQLSADVLTVNLSSVTTRLRQFSDNLQPVRHLSSSSSSSSSQSSCKFTVCVQCVYIFYPDTVPPIHVVSYHVATDKLPSQDGDKLRSIFSDNLQPVATRGKKAHGMLLVDWHCGNGCSIKRAPLPLTWQLPQPSQCKPSSVNSPRSFLHLWVCTRCLLVVVVVEDVYLEVTRTLWCRLLLRKIAVSSIRDTCVH